MHTLTHAVISGLLSIILYPIYGVNVIYLFLGGFFMDIDHVFMIPFKLKYLNISKQYRQIMHYIKNKSFESVKETLFILHSIEFLIILLVMSFYSEIFILILIGVVLHHLLDMIYEFFVLGELVKVNNMSAILWILRRI
jgi:hypothetical protein